MEVRNAARRDLIIMANEIVKNLDGDVILTDGKTIKDWIGEAEFDETAAENEEPIQLVVMDESDGANFCTECGSRNIYCVREAKDAYQLVCRDCGHRLGFRTRQYLNQQKTDEANEKNE